MAIRQDFALAIRPVFFQTKFEEFLYATHGGTLFVVAFRGRPYALTCQHVFQDFPHGTLFITNEKWAQKGSKPAPVKGLYYPSSPFDAAVGTDVTDMCVLEFDDDIANDFFKGSAYVLDEGTVATSVPGDNLLVACVLKEKTSLVPPEVVIGYRRLEFSDVGPTTSDPTLRKAIAEYTNPDFSNLSGMSGSPVFNQTANALCGMVVRGGMAARKCRIHYIDIFDIMRLLEAVSTGKNQAYYKKTLWRPRE